MKYIILLILSLMSCATKKQEVCGFYRNPFNQIIFRHKIPVTAYVDKSVPQKYHESIYKAAQSINKAAGKVIIALSYDRPYGANANVIYYGTKKLDVNQQAVTTTHWAGGEIIKADIFINDRFSYYSTGEKVFGYNMEALMLHEFGHFIGLGHDEVGSVMNTYLAAKDDRINLTEKDVRNIRCVY